jgi:hypothetical protein
MKYSVFLGSNFSKISAFLLKINLEIIEVSSFDLSWAYSKVAASASLRKPYKI